MREPFFRRIGSSRPVAVSAANYLADTALGRFDASEGWPYAFAYVPAYGDQREITNFLSDGTIGYAYVSPNWTTTPGVSAEYEIHSIWSAQEKTDALNHAIRDAWPAFYEVAVDESIVVQKWKKEYSLANFAHLPRHLLGVYIEPMWKVDQYVGVSDPYLDEGRFLDSPYSYQEPLADNKYVIQISAVGPAPTYNSAYEYEIEVTAGTGSGKVYHVAHNSFSGGIAWVVDEVVSPALDATSVVTIRQVPHQFSTSTTEPAIDSEIVYTPGKNWPLESGKTYEVSVYYGTGAGQSRYIVAGDSGVNGFFVTEPWTTVLDPTSEFAVKNITDQAYNWQGPIARYRVDSPEAPTMMSLHWDAAEYWGAKLRVIYAYEIEELIAEASAVPDQASDFLVHMAAYHLWLGNIGRGPQFETKTAEKMAQQARNDAEQLRNQNRMKRLTGQVRLELDNYGPAMREKPFGR